MKTTKRQEREVPNADHLPEISRESVYSFEHGGPLPTMAEILNADSPTQFALLRECAERIAGMRKKLGKPSAEDHRYMNLQNQKGFPRIALQIVDRLLRHNLPWTLEDLAHLVNRTADLEMVSTWCLPYLPLLAKHVERHIEAHGLTDELRFALDRLRQAIYWIGNAPERKLSERLARLCRGPKVTPLEEGEAWSDTALADLKAMKENARTTWIKLLAHCLTASGSKPSANWVATAKDFVRALKPNPFKKYTLKWFQLVDKPRTNQAQHWSEWQPDPNLIIIDPHATILKGLVWCCGWKEDAELARALMRLALSSYRKIPLKGPRLVSLGNACVTALGMMPGLVPIGQLAILKVKVKFGTAQKEIEKAFNAAAARENLPRDEIEELAVPSYGLEEIGVLRESFGDYQAEGTVDGSTASLHWLKEGKPIKSVPAAVKKDHPAELKELQTAVKDINTMLPAQRERIDTLFLAQKTWPLAIWRERYLDHPLVGTIARRLIWSFTVKSKKIAGIWHGGELVGLNSKPLSLKEDVTVSLWHPIDQPLVEIIAWRDWLERREVVQPFKQAHREVYILTDAERRTQTYSNRFAAHILRQHQFSALCAARGWKNKLRLMVDADYPPAHRLLPAWNLRAEYWIEGAGTEYGQDTNEAGAFLYLTTDQVRFYAINAAQMTAHAGGGGYGRWDEGPDQPLALETIPPLVFSEIMRDVDLFVGVANVGNDANWSDGGPGGRYRDYWQSYSFGELSATAQTRRALLERLIPRLKVADRCTLSERFLIVRGALRTYKIHLGSGNILMSPNDQYLCIVPKQAVAGHERVFLPFEGDNILSVILSKAFLLADDTKITDPTITSQLKK